MSASRNIRGNHHLRTRRGMAVVLLALTYLFGGALHGALCAHTITVHQDVISIASAEKADGQSDKGTIGEHHCHGCFSISVPQPAQMSIMIEQRVATVSQPQAILRDRVPVIDTPPPKYTT